MKNRKVVNIKDIEKPRENPITHFTVSVFLKSGKEITIKDVLLIEVNAAADLIVVMGKGWTKVYPISNLEHYEFIEHREEGAKS